MPFDLNGKRVYLNWTHNKKRKQTKRMNIMEGLMDGGIVEPKAAQLPAFQLEGGGVLRTNVPRLGLAG